MTDQTAGGETWSVSGGSFEQGLENGWRLLDGHPEVALQQGRTLLNVRADPRAHRLTAAALRALGQAEDAEQQELSAIRLGLADERLNDIAGRLADGDAGGARQRINVLLQRESEDLLARTLAAEISLASWDLPDAEEKLRMVLDRAPSFLRASMLMATCLARQARLREATSVLESAVQRTPGNVHALSYLAQLHGEAGEPDRAAAIMERLVEVDGARANWYIHLAQYRRILGQREAAIAAFRKALDVDPANGSAWWGLSNYYPEDIAVGDLQAMRAAAGNSRSKVSDRGALHLAIGNIEDRQGDHRAAFADFKEGKRIRQALQPHDPGATSATIDSVIAAFSPALVTDKQIRSANPAPIFIIGMPRSGSTLVMRILGQHTEIEDAGELPIFPRLAEQLRFSRGGGGRYGAMLQNLTTDDLVELGDRYVARAAEYRREQTPLFIDKFNLNWLHSGLIRLALPNARIIDVRRNALDCCWANFKMLFAEGHPAANDLRSIGRFYRDYVRMVDAVDAAAPGAILRVNYEEVVNDLDGQTRRMLDFLGLPFEPRCTAFHEGKGPVATASSEQVRRPLYRDAVGSAEPYREWLEELVKALGESS